MSSSLNAYRASRDNFLARIVQTLSMDDQFVAAWLTGSFGRNEEDAVSDLDLSLVVSTPHSMSLCKRIEQVSPQTSPERLQLFSQFGTPAILHENNHNAPEGGTFTFVLYSQSSIMVDWTLVPQEKAFRPAQGTRSLFEKSSIPVTPPSQPESAEQRIKKAAEITAFFWMMMAVTSKYIVRKDSVFVTRWLEELYGMLREVERLIAGGPSAYQRGSLSTFQPTHAEQIQAITQLGKRMQSLLPELDRMGGHALPSPLPEIQHLLDLAEDE
jgi:hypothetical protein